MSLLGIGVFTGVVISKVTASKNDQGLTRSVDITFKKQGDVAVNPDSLDFLNTGEVSSSDAGKENNMRIYSADKLTSYEGDAFTGDELLNAVMGRKDQLVHIMSAYMTADKIKFDLTKGLGVKTKAELVTKITNEVTLAKINDNLLTQFADAMQPVIGEDSKTVVVKFLRQSKAKNFPRLADRKLDWNPFIAASDDKALVAKIKFSDWEKKEGFDSNAQVSDDTDSISEELAAQSAAVNDVFN